MVVVVVNLVKICKVSKMGLIFTLIQSLHLAPLCWSTWSTSVMMVNIKVVHFHMVLDDMTLVDQG
jgi:hypothetical protein